MADCSVWNMVSVKHFKGGTYHGLSHCSFRPPGIARRLGIYAIGESRIPRGLDPATAWDHLLADYHPGLLSSSILSLAM
jgi:hypothetical protein